MYSSLKIFTCFLIGSAILFFPLANAIADQTTIPNYAKARHVFWSQLYPVGGRTLYCTQRFTSRIGLQIDHVYPSSWMVDHLKCGSRKVCRKVSRRFNFMEADLHNLYPAISGTNRARSNMVYGNVAGEKREFGSTCDFEIDKRRRVAEPPPNSRGNIARSIFYMQKEYGLPIGPEQLIILNKWNLNDPPDNEERRRNSVIESLQIKRNRFIDGLTQ